MNVAVVYCVYNVSTIIIVNTKTNKIFLVVAIH